MRLFLKILLLCSLPSLFLAACGQESEETTPDIKVFLNGTIYTGLEDYPVVEAVVVEGNRITFTGSATQAAELAGAGGEIVDLGGAYMFPGFTDSHMHLRGVGQRELTLNLEDTPSIAALVEQVAGEVARSEAGQIIVGRGWIETHWPEGRFPAATDLDAASPDNPVILVRADGHAAVVNSRLLDLAGITAATEDPFAGRILHDESGQPTGMLIDGAMVLVEGIALREPTQSEKARFYRAGGEVYNAYGWTGVHNMSVAAADVEIMEKLAADGGLILRVYNSLDGADTEVLAFFDGGVDTATDGLITTRAIKLYMDGALGSRGALLLAPYADADTSGLLQMEKADMMAVFLVALESGIQVNTHAIGDAGNRLLLDWYAEAFAAVPEQKRAIADPRWRDEHSQILDPADIPRFAELGIIPSMQPSHAIGDLFFAPDRLGQERLAGAYAWRSLIDEGSIIAGGSDAPVERGDPRIEFYAAVARKSLDGFSGEGWHPELAVSRAEALKMFTIWPAYAAFMEDDLGTIEVGKLADFTVFSSDIMTIPEAEILEVDVIMTVVDGEIVYRNPDE